MWNPDKDWYNLYRATWLSLWLALWAEQGELQAAHNALRSLSGSDRGLIWSLHPVISPLLTQVSHKKHPCAVERNTDGVVLSIPALSGSVSEGVPWKRGLFDHYFSFILFLHLAIWFSLFPLLSISADFPLLNISDGYIHWIFVGSIVGLPVLSKIKAVAQGMQQGIYTLFRLPGYFHWGLGFDEQLWHKSGQTKWNGGFHASEDHSLHFLPVFSHEKWSSPGSCKWALGFVCFRLYNEESAKHNELTALPPKKNS